MVLTDTAGMEEFESMQADWMRQNGVRINFLGESIWRKFRIFFNNIYSGNLFQQGFLMVYSITNHDSFEKLDALYEKIMYIQSDSGHSKVPMVLVGNKSDLNVHREVTTEEGVAKAEKWGCPFIECSAKENKLVAEAFTQCIRQLPLPKEKKRCFFL